MFCCQSLSAQLSVPCLPDSTLQRKLGQEYEASHVLQIRSQKELEECKLQLRNTEDSHKRVMEQLTSSYESRLQESLLQLQQVRTAELPRPLA